MRFFQIYTSGAAVGLYALFAAVMACTAAVTAVRADDQITAAAVESHGGDFTKKSFRIQGNWSITTEADGRRILRFDDAFKTRNAPDLKVFLSPEPVASRNGRNATDGALLISPLTSHKGAQEYEIPADVDLTSFGSLLVHCEAYSKLWGGSDLS